MNIKFTEKIEEIILTVILLAGMLLIIIHWR